MKFSDHLRGKILEKHGTFRKAAEILEKKEEELTRKLSNKSERSSPRKIWLTEIDEWDEKLNLSLLEDIGIPLPCKELESRIESLERKIRYEGKQEERRKKIKRGEG